MKLGGFLLLCLIIVTLVANVFTCKTISKNNLPLNQWTYIQVDDNRTRYDGRIQGDGYWFGLAMGDITGDGYLDIASGKWFYRNPGGDMEANWIRTTFPDSIDLLLFVDVDGDEYGDLIGAKCNRQYWFEAEDHEGSSWKKYQIGSLPVCNHGTTTQGYSTAQIYPGGKIEILLHGEGIYCLEIPENPETGEWPVVTIIEGGGNQEWLGTGDIDGDGDIDVCAGFRPAESENDVNEIGWLENPGDGSGNWQKIVIGTSRWHVDKVLPADFNRDGRVDLAVAEEIWPGLEPDASMYLFFAPPNPKSANWPQKTVVTQYSMNNLDLADMDNDGDIDIITCEHKGPHEKLQIWVNDGKGNFKENMVDIGKESHLGARVADMDNDGDLDIVSIAWNDFEYLHLWRNDGIVGSGTGKKQKPPLGLDLTGDYAYKLPITVHTGKYPRINKPVELEINFSEEFNKVGEQLPFDFSSIRLVEVDAEGKMLKDQVIFQFEKGENFDSLNNASGKLTFLLEGRTEAEQSRQFYVLFGPEGKYYAAPVFLKQVVFDDYIQHAGSASYRLVTPSGTYFYHKKGSGFASMIDPDGFDWISYLPEGGPKGNYRGIPNIAPAGFHPGTGEKNKLSRIIAKGPIKVSFLSETEDEKWGCIWNVYPTYASMTLFKKGEDPYWILYEGTPGGEFTTGDFYVTSAGEKVDIIPFTIKNMWHGDLPDPEWVYFGDAVQNRVLYFIHHEYSPVMDEFWHFGDGGMTVFGFGRGPREEGWQRLTDVPARLTIGFAETTDFEKVREIINSAYQELIIRVGDPLTD
jgi:hypothetical protein